MRFKMLCLIVPLAACLIMGCGGEDKSTGTITPDLKKATEEGMMKGKGGTKPADVKKDEKKADDKKADDKKPAEPAKK